MSQLRQLVVGITALAVFVACAPPALGGGWAVTTLDPIAEVLVPGRTVDVGYTIRQHGRTPVDLVDTGIEITTPGQKPVFRPGHRSGPVGHYVARITVPAGGAQWSVRQDWFGLQQLGAVPIDAGGPRAATATTAPEQPGITRWLLLGGTVLAAAMLAGQLVARRRTRPAAA